MFKILVKVLGKLSRINIEAQSLPNSMVSRALYMHSQLAQAIENALISSFKQDMAHILKQSVDSRHEEPIFGSVDESTDPNNRVGGCIHGL